MGSRSRKYLPASESATVPMGGGIGDVLEGGGVEALRLEEGVGGGARLIARELVVGRFAEAGDGDGQRGESRGRAGRRRSSARGLPSGR